MAPTRIALAKRRCISVCLWHHTPLMTLYALHPPSEASLGGVSHIPFHNRHTLSELAIKGCQRIPTKNELLVKRRELVTAWRDRHNGWVAQ